MDSWPARFATWTTAIRIVPAREPAILWAEQERKSIRGVSVNEGLHDADDLRAR
jgi:hypothetical protein